MAIDLDAIKDRLNEYDAVWPGLEDSKATWWATRLYEAAGDLLAEVERLQPLEQKVADEAVCLMLAAKAADGLRRRVEELETTVRVMDQVHVEHVDLICAEREELRQRVAELEAVLDLEWPDGLDGLWEE